MAKKMQRLEASNEFRPFKFRIQAFTNSFHDSLVQSGLTEDILPLRKVKIYLWRHRYISRFNEDGKKQKSKGNHVWNIEARKITDSGQQSSASTPVSVGGGGGGPVTPSSTSTSSSGKRGALFFIFFLLLRECGTNILISPLPQNDTLQSRIKPFSLGVPRVYQPNCRPAQQIRQGWRALCLYTQNLGCSDVMYVPSPTRRISFEC